MRLLTCFVALTLVGAVLVSDSSAACRGKRGRGRGRGNAVVAAELRLERDRLLLEQQAVILGTPGVPTVGVTLGL